MVQKVLSDWNKQIYVELILFKSNIDIIISGGLQKKSYSI